jgi:thymidylate synthase (FAD)
MKNFVQPKVFLIGATKISLSDLAEYLNYTDQTEFAKEIDEARNQYLSDGEILCSFYAKLCYASLTTKKNKNISKVRGVYDNILNTIESQHESVFEHASLNFVITDCSRVFTHEIVRHRVGTAFSQTSGRYVRTDELNIVVDPILESVYENVEHVRSYLEDAYKFIEHKMLDGITDFDEKKRRTSALRRILPNGQANEIGFTINLRSLRHLIELRTSRHAEWEIRVIFNQIAELVKDKYPGIFADAKYENIRSLNEITFKNKKI